MKSLCTCAALAVATAFAHEHFADAFLRSSQVHRESLSDQKLDTIEDCTEVINNFRHSLGGGKADYKQLEGENLDTDSEDDLRTFFTQELTCENLQKGHFAHISQDQGAQNIFVITAPKSSSPPEAARAQRDQACDAALKEWKTGFQVFKNGNPPAYTDPSKDGRNDDNLYANPNAAALVSLLQKGEQKLVCGTMANCTNELELLCYFKPGKIEEEALIVDPKLWHALEGEHNLRPKLQLPDKVEDGYNLDAVNKERQAVELDKFKVPERPKSPDVEKRASEPDTLQPAIEKFLYELTCGDLSIPNLSSAQPEKEDFTVIYYIKDVGEEDKSKIPTLQEAVDYWKEGFKTLQYKRPPAFKKEKPQREQVSDAGEQAKEKSNIYNDSRVAGYAAIMAEGAQHMACVVVSGCEKPGAVSSRSFRTGKTYKSGLICVIHKATLKEDVRPISQKTWNKIMKEAGHPIPDFKPLDSSANCLQEMNAVRTQEKLGLKPFVPKTPATTARSGSQTELVLSSVMESVTCKAIGGDGAESSRTTGAETTSAEPSVKIADDKSSLMYHTYTGDEKTCSAAVEAWKKGFEKFAAAPPAYKTTDPVYQDAAARNFVSLISEGEKTEVTCYETNCTKNGIVCELSPAALREDQTPVSADTWTKYTAIVAEGEGQGAGAGAGAGADGNAQPESSGVAGYSKAALVGTVVMTLAGGVFM